MFLTIIPKCIDRCVECGGLVEPSMEHAFCCQAMGHGNLHHSVKMATYKALRQIARHIGDDALLEPSVSGYMRDIPENRNNNGSQVQRRGDVAVYNVVEKNKIMIDVRTCAITSAVSGTSAVARGEVDKREYYTKVCDFPDSVRMVPFAIDTYGRWGDEFSGFLQEYCRRGSRGNEPFYSLLITRARNMIQAAHASSVGMVVRRSMDRCISDADRILLASRGSGSRDAG